MKVEFKCEKCGEVFADANMCVEHERSCKLDSPIRDFSCMKCGKTKTYDINDLGDKLSFENQCHSIKLGRLGYGSKYDGCLVDIDLCDDCLGELVRSLMPSYVQAIEDSGYPIY